MGKCLHPMVAMLCFGVAQVTLAAEIKVLSAGAVEPGIEAFAHQLKRDTGHDLEILFNTALQIAKRLAAESVVYNTASTGLYLDKLFGETGILEQIKPKSTRYVNGASMLEHVIKGKGNEIGFGAITEIRMYEPKGLKYVGPLPAEVQNHTNYDAVLMTGATAADAARQVLKVMAAPASKAIFVKAGVE